MEVLEYPDITAEIKGLMTPGRLKITDQNIVFKNSKTGKVEQINAADIELANLQRFVGNYGIRIFTKNGALHRFCGFKEQDSEKIINYFKSNYKKDLSEKEMCVKGCNWGTAKFFGSVLSFDVDSKTTFEIPLNHVSQCMTGKNEVTLEFHQNDDAPVGLMEMRFHVPSTEASETDPVDNFYSNVMNKASVISVSGDAIAIFREIQCLTPRGRYDIKIFPAFFQLHGKTFDYKIPMSTVLRLFLLPHKDSRQTFFVLSLDPPIKQGQTRYHYLVLLFGNEEEVSIELPFSETELKEKYESKLTKELSGPVYEVLGKVMKVLVNRKLTGPGSFIGHSQTPAIGCSFKAAAGYLYPLERGFIYVHKPSIHIRFEEIAAVNFARSGGSTRSFDFEIELKSGTVHTFSSIEKEEYKKLYDFIITKKLHIKNRGKNDKATYEEDFGNSDNENEPDAYLERVKAEAQERDSDADDDEGSEEESTDEDFKPNEVESDVAEEYDSNVPTDSSDDSDEGSDDEAKQRKKEKKEKKKEKKEKEKKSSAPRKTKKKKDRDSNKPKRPPTAFMLWLNESRESIKKENPAMKITEVAKRAGELWKDLKDKADWEKKAAKEKEKYMEAMKAYNESGGGGAGNKSKDSGDDDDSKAAKKRKKESPTKKSSTAMSGAGYKSKEYISESDSTSSESGGEKKKSKKDANGASAKKAKPNSKSKKASDHESNAEDEDEDEETGADESSEGGDDE